MCFLSVLIFWYGWFVVYIEFIIINAMKKNEFIEGVTGLVWVYINNQDMLGKNAQIRVNPVLLTIDLFNEKEFLQGLADAQEAVENTAYAHDAAQYEDADYQAQQNPDFYPARSLMVKDAEGKWTPDNAAIEALAANYSFS